MNPRISPTPTPTPGPLPTGSTSISRTAKGKASGSVSHQKSPTTVKSAEAFRADPLSGIVEQLLARISTLKTELTTVLKGTAQQRRSDQEHGIGILDGAGSFAKTVSSIFSSLASEGKGQTVSLGDIASDPIDRLGGLAQKQLLGDLKDEAIGEALSWLDIDPDKFSLESLLSGDFSSMAPDATVPGPTAPNEAGAAAAGGSAADRIMGGLGAAYSLYNLFQGWGKGDIARGALNGFAAGGYLGSFFTPVGTVIGGAIGALVGAAGGFFRSGKSEDQIARDQVRELMQKNGMLDSDWQIQLAGGTLYDIGKDGGHRLKNLDGAERRAYQVDFENPLAHEAIGWVQPLAALICGGVPKLTTEFTGYFTNAVLSNATDRVSAHANALAFFQSLKIPAEQVVTGLGALLKEGKISEQVAQAFVGGFAGMLKLPDQAPLAPDAPSMQAAA